MAPVKDNEPLQLADVQLYSNRRIVLTTKTDSHGHFVLRGIRPGNYKLAFKGMGEFEVDVVQPQIGQGFFYRFSSDYGCLGVGFTTN